MGYEIKTVKDSDKCLKFLTNECAVCVLENGTEVEVTELMGLSFEETVCGDGTCGIPENFKTCPEDCPSGSSGGYCDGIKDGICNPDCTKDADPDCAVAPAPSPTPKPTPSFLPIALILVVIIAVIAVLAVLLRRRKKGK